VLWILFSFPRVGGETVPIEQTYAGIAGQNIAYAFAPMHYDWKISTALVA